MTIARRPQAHSTPSPIPVLHDTISLQSPMLSRLPTPIRALLRPFYHQFTAFRQSQRQRRAWNAAPTFPAVKNYATSTRTYFDKTQRPPSDYIPLPDKTTFHRTAPRTLGDNQLAHVSIPYNPPLYVAIIKNATVRGDVGDIITPDQ